MHHILQQKLCTIHLATGKAQQKVIFTFTHTGTGHALSTFLISSFMDIQGKEKTCCFLILLKV